MVKPYYGTTIEIIEIQPGEARDVQAGDGGEVYLLTHPIVATRSVVVECAGVVLTVACGRQENGGAGGYIGNPPAVYAVYGCPFAAYLIIIGKDKH